MHENALLAKSSPDYSAVPEEFDKSCFYTSLPFVSIPSEILDDMWASYFSHLKITSISTFKRKATN